MATLTYMPTEHVPVLAPELIALVDPGPGELVVDLFDGYERITCAEERQGRARDPIDVGDGRVAEPAWGVEVIAEGERVLPLLGRNAHSVVADRAEEDTADALPVLAEHLPGREIVGIDLSEVELPLDEYGSIGDFFVRRLRAAGVEVRHTSYRGAPHGFLNFPGLAPAARPALQELIGELRHHLHPEDR